MSAHDTSGQPAGFAVLIPAYRPGPALIELVERLARSDASAILVVDDGSGPEFADLFRRLQDIPGVRLLQHAVNLGKGAALKTGINYFLCNLSDGAGVVTADADGQHTAGDVLRIGAALQAHPDSLILGSRHFATGVPLRSRFGNKVSAALVRILIGQDLSDTQTGLRGIPTSLLPHLLKIAVSGYEFELEMLITAKHLSYPMREEPIETIYIDDNQSSHFNPLLDSMRIYFILLRFGMLSLLTALVDNAVFFSAFRWTGSVARSQIAGRLAAVLFNYGAARRVVFLSRQSHRVVLPKYLLLVLGSGLLSYALIRLFVSGLSMNIMAAKLLAEGLIFIVNFTMQRDFVFTKRATESKATDWDEYYTQVPFTAHLTRKYTSAVLVGILRNITGPEAGVLVEIGGANSCFIDSIQRSIQPRQYYVVDNNKYGLELLRKRTGADQGCQVLHEDVLNLRTRLQADVVFSVGLIEHFSPPETRRAVRAHFDLLRPGGYAILSFPTPTLLYRVARGLCEIAGLWKFPDERPLQRAEVFDAVREEGQVIHEKILWPIIFTQHVMVVRKRLAARKQMADA